MIYRPFQDLQLSALGMGTMRFPVIDGDYSKIDVARVENMVEYALSHGVNYIDTAWVYHNGNAESVLGEILKKYPRENFCLATKFPGFDLENITKVREIFEAQLKNCQVDYFDFYLFHNVCESNIDYYLDEQYGIFEYLMAQKQAGRIRHLGFSGHGSVAVLRRFLEKYGYAMEFGQLQLNWLDWEFQNAKEKYELLKSYNIPVWIMEPLRGGKLCTIPAADEAKLRALRPDATVTSWAFRFLQSLPEVTMVLSGMSDEQQLSENVATFETSEPLTEEEMQVLLGIADDMIARTKLPCTACRYCTAHCPRELDIPTLLEMYNRQTFSENGETVSLEEVAEGKGPSACLGCRACEQVCPQGIKISEAMGKFSSILG